MPAATTANIAKLTKLSLLKKNSLNLESVFVFSGTAGSAGMVGTKGFTSVFPGFGLGVSLLHTPSNIDFSMAASSRSQMACGEVSVIMAGYSWVAAFVAGGG